MVPALLSGSKTQTRRALKFNGWSPEKINSWRLVETITGDDCKKLSCRQPPENAYAGFLMGKESHSPAYFKCPYGQVGDQLWVKETSRVGSNGWHHIDGHWHYLEYKADNSSRMNKFEAPKHFPSRSHNFDGSMRWHPSIFMPRWASRIQLEITGVRVERLMGISEDDATKEMVCSGYIPAVDEYQEMWEKINGAGSWAANPWVWVIEFKVIKGCA